MYVYVYVAMFVCTYTYTCIECTCKTDTDYTLASHHDLTVKLALCVIETCSAHHTYLMVCYNNVVAMQEVISPMVPNTTPGLTNICSPTLLLGVRMIAFVQANEIHEFGYSLNHLTI